MIGIKTLNYYISKCTAFIYEDYDNYIYKRYYGGGYYSKAKSSVVLWLDYLRPNFDEIHIDLINTDITFSKRNNTLTMKLEAGGQITGYVLNRIPLSKNCNCRDCMFDDLSLIDIINNTYVVKLNMLNIQHKDFYHGLLSLDIELAYPSPLTIAYTKEEDIVYYGLYDVVFKRFVNKPERYPFVLHNILQDNGGY